MEEIEAAMFSDGCSSGMSMVLHLSRCATHEHGVSPSRPQALPISTVCPRHL